MRAPMLAAGVMLALAACAEAPAPTGVSSGSPTPQLGYDWFFHDDGAEAQLAYGVAESDDVPISLSCLRGAGQISILVPAPDDAPSEIYLESGGETERWPAASEPSQLHDGVYLTAVAAADAPVLQRFRREGWLALWQDGERHAYASHPGSADGIGSFFTVCG